MFVRPCSPVCRCLRSHTYPRRTEEEVGCPVLPCFLLSLVDRTSHSHWSLLLFRVVWLAVLPASPELLLSHHLPCNARCIKPSPMFYVSTEDLNPGHVCPASFATHWGTPLPRNPVLTLLGMIMKWNLERC